MIYLPPPQPVLNKDIRISGDVEIHPTASLAPGVILQAAPNSRIIIGADVCIGMGAIINACQGNIEIETGAILGSGVLIIGQSIIGNNSCIGTSTTIFQENVAPMAVVEPGSIVGDGSRQVNTESKSASDKQNSKSPAQPPQTHDYSNNGFDRERAAKTQPSTVRPSDRNSASIPQVEISTKPVQKSKEPVVGQVYINELLVTLFPHKKSPDSNSTSP